jgi:hypothetical protein
MDFGGTNAKPFVSSGDGEEEEGDGAVGGASAIVRKLARLLGL